MPVATEMKLPQLPVDDQAFREDPMAFIDPAREEHPWRAKTDYGFLIHGYQAMKDILMFDDKLSPRFEELVRYYGVEGTPWAKFQVEQLIGHTSPKHRRIRMSVGDAFTPRNVNKHIDLLRCGWKSAEGLDAIKAKKDLPLAQSFPDGRMVQPETADEMARRQRNQPGVFVHLPDHIPGPDDAQAADVEQPHFDSLFGQRHPRINI